MYKIFIPTTKDKAPARGYWTNEAGQRFRDFIRYEIADKVTTKYLDGVKASYNQEAIFYEAINNKTGRYNRAYCYYSKGKKDVFNRRMTYYLDGIGELKRAIASVRRQGHTCYTIQKGQGRQAYELFYWTTSAGKTKKARIYRRNQLLKRLFDNAKKVTKYNDYGVPCTLTISKNKPNKNLQYTGSIFLPEITIKNQIILNPRLIRYNRVPLGYTKPNYYDGRTEKINPIIQHNYKKALRFVLLHELGHATFNCKYSCSKYTRELYTPRLERYADNFALRYINKV